MASVFSGKAGRNAAIWTAGQAQNQLSELKDIYKTGRSEADTAITGSFQPSLDALNQYYQQQRGDLQTGLADANVQIMQGYGQGRSDLQGGYGAAIDAANNFYGQGADALRQGVNAYQPLVDQNMAGFGMYQNALGLNGKEGNAAATNAFQAGPGYQWNVDQATDQAARAANRLGMTYSGNTVDAQTRLASNLANQEYGNWVNRLSGFQSGAQNAVAGQAGVLGNLAQLYGNQAGLVSGLEAGQGKDLAALAGSAYGQMGQNALNTGNALGQAAGQQGQNLATMYTNQGQSLANNALGYMQNLAGANQNFYQTLIPAGQQGMMAGQQAAANRMGAVMGGLQLGSSLIGGMFGMSDRRTKTDIERIGTLPNGLPFYAFRYKGDDALRVGLMADEVKRVRPDAVVNIEGYDVVDYGKAVL